MVKQMNVLIACEESQRVCIEFRKLGHRAFSCDIMECSGGHPEWHIQGDVLELLNPDVHALHDCQYYGFHFQTMDGIKHRIRGRWDMIIAFPPCTYMTKAGACRMFPHSGQIDSDRFIKAMAAKEFFMAIYNADCEKIAIENPTPLKVVGLPNSSQVIQPYQFGHPYSKRTLLWLKGLPPLESTSVLGSYAPYVASNTSKFAKGGGGSLGVAKVALDRSKTFLGIAKAMAEQWGGQVDE